MMRSRFDTELDSLNTELIEMGAMVESVIDDACRALTTRSLLLARETMAFDPQVDKKERQIEALCLRLLLTQQPVAKDLRLISAAMKMITDMERIGDQAQDISEIITFLAQQDAAAKPPHIREMADHAIGMVHDSVDAFVRRDVTLARGVMDADDAVDSLFLKVRDDLALMLAPGANKARDALDLLMIAKYLERIADHAVNVAEWVEFAVTGIHKGEKLQ